MSRSFLQLVSAIALACALSGCGNSVNAGKTAGPQAFPVQVVTVQAQMVPQSTDYLATLKSRSASVLQPQVEGDVTQIFAHSGEQVEAGASILEIDPTKQEATVKNQEAAHKSKVATMEQARIDLERKKQLFAVGVIARADLDLAQSTYNAAVSDVDALEASIREQRVQLRYYTVRAPTAGVVGDIPVRVGDHVTSATTLTTLDRGGELEAYIEVPAEKSSALRLGMPVDLLDDQDKPVLRTRIFFISPRVGDSQTLLVKTRVPGSDTRFRNAQQVHARVVWSEQKRPVIPLTAVSRLSGKIFAFVADTQGSQTVAHQKLLQVGDMVGNDYVVLDGINPGEKVIVSGVQTLTDGMPVAVTN